MEFEVIPRVIHIFATVYAVIAASVALRIAQHHNNRALKRRLDEFEADLDKQAAWYAKLNANVASVRATISQHKKDAATPEAAEPELPFGPAAGETPDQWKKRMRAQLAAGNLQHR
jgi:hypothetical protein